MYELAVEPEELAKAYIQRFYRSAEYVMRISPKARVKVLEDRVLFKYTALGRRWTHHVYVEFKATPSKRAGVFTVRPAYPMYLLAVMAPFAVLSFPAMIIRIKESVRGLLVEDPSIAVSVLADAMTKYKLLEPGDFTEEEGVSFEGILYETPAGYVAFLSDKEPFRSVDVIEGHVEDEGDEPDIMYPRDFLVKWIGLEGEKAE